MSRTSDDPNAAPGSDPFREGLRDGEPLTGDPFAGLGQAVPPSDGLLRTLLTDPSALLRRQVDLLGDLAKVALGRSDIDPSADKRFADAAFTDHPLYKRWAQGYLAWARSVHAAVDGSDVDEPTRLRSRFEANLLTEAFAPTNGLAGNPAAIKEAVRTRGASLVAGAQHFAADARDNGGMPAMVEREAFEVGRNLALTPGSVVFRNDVLELIRYRPATPTVWARPLLVVPPQINKYYVLDLAPGRSLVESAVADGQQVFMVSWRNPGAEHAPWGLDAYCSALLEAIDVARDLTGSEDLNLMGVCAGGITSAALLGYLAAIGDRRVHAATLLVAVLDWSNPSTIGTFTSGPSASSARAKAAEDGILSGAELAKLFAWLRPNDLVWNYWVNNYLMGRKPAAFDILAWNDDATNLPAALLEDFLAVAGDNALAEPGGVRVLGEKVDLAAVVCDAYVVGGLTDHITPWEGCYETTRLFGGRTEFVLCASGHIQTLVCPLDNPKAKFLTNGGDPLTAAQWKATATENRGSWWGHWLGWMRERSGESVRAPRNLGNRRHPSLCPAPGTYVLRSPAD
jgi:polyhydroxyalkanoate synthase subunit PhaC